MVLPASPADPDADPTGLARIAARIARGRTTRVQLVTAPSVALLPELFRALPTGSRIVRSVGGLQGLNPRDVVVLLIDRLPIRWLNTNRPFFASMELDLIVWANPDTTTELAETAPDFYDWISHRETVDDALPSWTVRSIRAAVADRRLLFFHPRYDAHILRWITKHVQGVSEISVGIDQATLEAEVRQSDVPLIRCDAHTRRSAVSRTRRAWWAHLQAADRPAVLVGHVEPPGALAEWGMEVPDDEAELERACLLGFEPFGQFIQESRTVEVPPVWGPEIHQRLTSESPDWVVCAEAARSLGEFGVAQLWTTRGGASAGSTPLASLPLPTLWEPMPPEPDAEDPNPDVLLRRMLGAIERGVRIAVAEHTSTIMDTQDPQTPYGAYAWAIAWRCAAYVVGATLPEWILGGPADLHQVLHIADLDPSEAPTLLASLLESSNPPQLRLYLLAKYAESLIAVGRFGEVDVALAEAFDLLTPESRAERAILTRIRMQLQLSRGGRLDRGELDGALRVWAELEPSHPEVRRLEALADAR